MKAKTFRSSAGLQSLVITVILIVGFSAALGKGVTKRIRFARGSSSAVVEGAVIRGEMDRYILGARAGQEMTVSIASVEDNAVFHIYRPGAKRTLEGAGEDQDATEWTGKLPASGDYVIVVGGTRGNATYKLSVKVE